MLAEMEEEEDFSDEEEDYEKQKTDYPIARQKTVNVVHKDDVGDDWNFKVFFKKKEIEKTLNV